MPMGQGGVSQRIPVPPRVGGSGSVASSRGCELSSGPLRVSGFLLPLRRRAGPKDPLLAPWAGPGAAPASHRDLGAASEVRRLEALCRGVSAELGSVRDVGWLGAVPGARCTQLSSGLVLGVPLGLSSCFFCFGLVWFGYLVSLVMVHN